MQQKEEIINEEAVSETAEETVVESQEEVVEEKELTPAEKLSQLEAERMGSFKVTLSLEDAKYLRNMLDKTEYKGPQQAYLLVISKLEMSGVCETLNDLDKQQRHTVEISSATIESLTFFMNNKVGKGVDSAQKLFAASMQLRPAITQINELDLKLESMREELSKKSK